MNIHAKRTSSVFATVAILTSTVFFIVGLMAVPVSAQEIVALSGETNGQVGQTLTYTARMTSLGRGTPMTGNIIFTVYNGTNVVDTATSATDSQGVAYYRYAFQQPGSYSVVARYSRNSLEVDDITVTIQASPTPTVTAAPRDNSGQPSGGTSDQTVTEGEAKIAETTSVSVVRNETPPLQQTAFGAINSFMSDFRWILSIAAIILAACYVILTIYIKRAR
jgi:hypothetical protein